jgi:Na+-translocating ferredoxin:NAD+ oxidoreductase RnfA subunit
MVDSYRKHIFFVMSFFFVGLKQHDAAAVCETESGIKKFFPNAWTLLGIILSLFTRKCTFNSGDL